MKHLPFLCCLLFFATALRAQPVEFAPIGARWHFAFLAPWVGEKGDYQADCLKETVVGGRLCKQIKVFVNGDFFGNRFIFQRGDSIFQHNFGSSPTFLFRNNYQVGEVTRTSMSDSYQWKVVGIDTLVFSHNQPVRRFHLERTDIAFEKAVIYDRFGPQLGFFGNWCGVPCDYNYYGICSYQDLGFAQVQVPNGDCSYLVSAKEPNVQPLSLSPNPADGAIRVSLPSQTSGTVHLQVFDLNGQQVLQLEEMPSPEGISMDVSHLPKGVYLFRAQSNLGIYQQRLVKH